MSMLLPAASALATAACAARARVCRPITVVRTHMSEGDQFTHAGLAGQSCSLLGGCSSKTPRVPVEQISTLMAALPAWQLSQDQTSISRRFTAKNFVSAVKFFNAVCEVAEAEGHHPDLHLTNYRDVEVVLSTHAIAALSMYDFIVAAKLDVLPVEYSPKWLKQNPHMLAAAAQSAAMEAGAAAAATPHAGAPMH